MQVVVNGEPHELAERTSIAELLRQLAVPHARVAVEVNEQVVSRDGYARHELVPGDRVEIVHFVGGG